MQKHLTRIFVKGFDWSIIACRWRTLYIPKIKVKFVIEVLVWVGDKVLAQELETVVDQRGLSVGQLDPENVIGSVNPSAAGTCLRLIKIFVSRGLLHLVAIYDVSTNSSLVA